MLQVHQNYYTIVVWILINGLQDITLKNYKQNIVKDPITNKTRGKDVSKSFSKK